MKKPNLLLLLSLFGSWACCSPSHGQGVTPALAPAPSSFTLDLYQAGSNVVATGSGNFNLTGLTYFTTGAPEAPAYLYPAKGAISLYGSSLDVDQYSGSFAGPSTFGSNVVSDSNVTSSGSAAGINIAASLLFVPSGYNSGTVLSDTAIWSDATLGSLGITPGTYTWSWNGGENTFTLNAGTVPEPLDVGDAARWHGLARSLASALDGSLIGGEQLLFYKAAVVAKRNGFHVQAIFFVCVLPPRVS